MAMAQPDEDGRPCGRRFVVALKRLARLDHRKAARGSDAERLQHFGREHFAHRALQGEPPVAETAVGSLARTLGAKVRQPSCLVAHLCEQEAPAVPDLEIGRAQVGTPVNNAKFVCRLMLEKKKKHKY